MKLKDIYSSQKPAISFEFFPPKSDVGLENLLETIAQLKKLGPAFVSMTYGAGGSTRQQTVKLVSRIKREINLEAVAHLACGGHTQAELLSILEDLEEAGIDNVLALRGDPPPGTTGFPKVTGGFNFAVELVRLIKSRFQFGIGVAGYPEIHLEAKSPEEDLRHLKDKVDAGADVIITQLFFDNRDFFNFVEKARKIGIAVPIVPGIMPIKDVAQIKRFTAMCGAKIPQALVGKLEKVQNDPEEVIQVGVDHATRQCEELIKSGVPGIHFYTLNKSQSTQIIFRKLNEKGLVSKEAQR